MAEDPATAEDDAARLVDEVAARAARGPAEPAPTAAVTPGPRRTADEVRAEMADARHRVEAAWHTSDSGTEIPESARLRHVKRAMLVGLRPVTSHQVPFNRELLVAVDRLANVVDAVAERVDGADERVDGRLKRVEAGIATVDLAGADADALVADLRARCDVLARRLDAAEADLVEQRRALAAARAREDVVLRAARAAIDEADVDVLAREADIADAALVRRLARVGRPPPDALRAQARAVVDVLAEVAVAAPVVDLASDAGEWLDVWAAGGIAAIGIDDDAETVAALRARGHAAEQADPLTDLEHRGQGSLGGITAAVLADVIALPDLIGLVDAARQALRPGGVLVLAGADPSGRDVDDHRWADPRWRPLDPRTLTLLVLERGWAEAELVALDAEAGARYVLVARTAGGTPSP